MRAPQTSWLPCRTTRKSSREAPPQKRTSANLEIQDRLKVISCLGRTVKVLQRQGRQRNMPKGDLPLCVFVQYHDADFYSLPGFFSQGEADLCCLDAGRIGTKTRRRKLLITAAGIDKENVPCRFARETKNKTCVPGSRRQMNIRSVDQATSSSRHVDQMHRFLDRIPDNRKEIPGPYKLAHIGARKKRAVGCKRAVERFSASFRQKLRSRATIGFDRGQPRLRQALDDLRHLGFGDWYAQMAGNRRYRAAGVAPRVFGVEGERIRDS